MREFLNIAKALSDKNRARALMMLRDGELCLCQLIEMLNLAPSTVSKHMSILLQVELVTARKEGRWNYYRLADDGPGCIAAAIEWAQDSLANDKQVNADKKKLERVRKKSKQELWQHYKTGKT